MKNKDERIQLRLSLEDKIAIERLARKYKTTVSTLILNSVLKRPIYMKWQPDINAENLKNELARIGRNLWQLIDKREKFDLPSTFKLQDVIDCLFDSIAAINKYYDSKSNH